MRVIRKILKGASGHVRQYERGERPISPEGLELHWISNDVYAKAWKMRGGSIRTHEKGKIRGNRGG